MRIKILLLCVLFLRFIPAALAQNDSLKIKPVYYASFVNGVMIGCGTCNNGKDFTYSVLTLHGIKFPSGIKIGIGVGMDVYSDWRLFPLVAGITFDQEHKKNALYFHVNTGHSWGRYLPENYGWWGSELAAQGGFTCNPMLGYRIGKDNMRIYIQAGYKLQLAYTTNRYAGGWGGNEMKRDYELNRFVVQFGFGFR